MRQKTEQIVPGVGVMAKSNELAQIRQALKLNQTDMGALLGVKQAGYQRWEDDPEKPAAQAALEKAKAIYQERTGSAWLPLKEVQPGTKGTYEPQVYQAGADQQVPSYGYMRPVGAGWEQSAQDSADRDRWLALQALENTLRERGLIDSIQEGERKTLARLLARGISAGDTLEAIQTELRVVVGVLEKSRGKGSA